MFTLRRLLTNVKDKDEPEARPGVVYKIRLPRHLCRETGTKLTTRLNEHKRATEY